MKIFLTILLAWTITSNALSQKSLKEDLIAHYKFNKHHLKDSTKVFDETKSNNGKIIGNIIYESDRFNNPCGALFFDGDTYVNVSNSKSLQKPTNGITIAVWFKIKKGADFFNQWITICCKSNINEENESSPQYRMQATAQTISLSSSFTKNVIPQLSYDKWYFYAYTYDGKIVKGYLDGKYFVEESYFGPLKINDMPMEIGRDMPGKMEKFYGTMDDLRIYDRALTENELLELFRNEEDATATDFCQNILQSKNPNLKTNKDSLSIIINQIDTTPIDFQKTIEVKNSNIVIYPYDHNVDDGDVISINVNGVWVKENYTIKAKLDNPPNEAIIKVKVISGQSNFIVTKVIHEGKIPLNTLTYMIDDGKTKQYIKVNSKIGLSGGIKILYNE
ncbi:MAG: LamG domain-containing protein [Saprospiraceae bacterium]|nr:LamG domain-containing protein [Saprospiraceae bacterium]